MNTDLIYSFLGLFGGILCSFADILLDLKGKDNKSIGYINTNWKKMALWRFHWSIIIAAIAIPLYNLGIYSLSNQVAEANPTLSNVFKIECYLSNLLGLFIHSTLCYVPCVYKALEKDIKSAEKAINALCEAAKIPFFVSYILLIFGISGTVIYAIVTKYINVSNYFILLTPICTLIFGMTLRKIKYDWFYDLPGIIMPSMGVGFIGLIGALNILLN